jgi:sulfate/thiosulfate transport system ATP-binding protein
VRPHDVTVSLTPTDGAMEATIKRVVYLGFEVRVELDLPGGEAARAQLTRAQADELGLADGDTVYVKWDTAPAPTRATA